MYNVSRVTVCVACKGRFWAQGSLNKGHSLADFAYELPMNKVGMAQISKTTIPGKCYYTKYYTTCALVT